MTGALHRGGGAGCDPAGYWQVNPGGSAAETSNPSMANHQNRSICNPHRQDSSAPQAAQVGDLDLLTAAVSGARGRRQRIGSRDIGAVAVQAELRAPGGRRAAARQRRATLGTALPTPASISFSALTRTSSRSSQSLPARSTRSACRSHREARLLPFVSRATGREYRRGHRGRPGRSAIPGSQR
jgi:hypothetical protein